MLGPVSFIMFLFVLFFQEIRCFPQLWEVENGAHDFGRKARGYQLNNEKNTGCLGYIGDDKLPSYIGIIIKYNKPL